MRLPKGRISDGPCDRAGRTMVLEAMHFRAFLIENSSVAVTLLEGVVDRLNAAQQRLEADRAWR